MASKIKIFESSEGMMPECKHALRNLLIACADTKLLLGYHYGEWTFGTPVLEASIACCSLCQSELGHVRLLHGILNAHFGDDPEALMDVRPPAEFANISYLDNEIKNWADFVSANYFVDLAVTALLYSMKDSVFKPLHMSLEKMLQEERYHIHHGQGWVRTLAQKSIKTRAALEKSGQTAIERVVEWFGPSNSEEDKALVDAGIKAQPNAAILQTFFNEVGTLAKSLKLDLALSRANGKAWSFKHSPKWNGWNPQTRRLHKTAPDELILYHLRGSKNKVFKLN